MDTSTIALLRAKRKESAVLSSIMLLSCCLTGCDTVQPAASTVPSEPSRPAMNADHHFTSVAASPEKSPRPVEPVPMPAAPARINEPKPAPAATPPKGAERLVALSAPAQPRATEPATPLPKPAVATAPKKDDPGANAATSDVPQSLFFKGPERQAAPASHKILWLGLGLGLCAAAGGGVAWLRFSRRKLHGIVPDNREEICLPKELMVKECTIPADEPVLAEKERVLVEKKPAFAKKKRVLVEKEPVLAEKA